MHSMSGDFATVIEIKSLKTHWVSTKAIIPYKIFKVPISMKKQQNENVHIIVYGNVGCCT